MRKFYSSFLSGKFLIIFVLLFAGQSKAQVTVATPIPSGIVYVSDTDPGVIIFGVKNTNPNPITITGIGSYLEAVAGTGTYTLWYHPTAITGAPTAITTANGWIQLTPSGTVTPVANTVIPIINGLNLTIPPNTTYRLALEGPIHAPYYGTSGSTGNLFTGGGLEIYAQANALSPTYAGIFPTLSTTFTPRSFFGTITYIPASACADPPTAGAAISSVTQTCTGRNFTLDLSGNTIGTGQTYQWQSSPDNNNWANLGAASASPILTTSLTATTYYRCLVACGAGSATSTSVQVMNLGSSISGDFTINSNLGTGGTNFQTFADAISALQCGVSGPVTFTVQSGSGPYNEQVTIPPISGASATRRITFKGNLATLSFNSTNTSARAGITLNGADFITIDSLVIEGETGTYGWGVHLTGAADNNIISNCVINVSKSNTTSGNHAPIVISGSVSSATTVGNNGNNNIIKNNTLTGGYYGVVLYGNSAAGSENVNNKVTGNTVNDVYGYSIYSLYQSGALIDSNNISRPTRTSALSGGAGVYLSTGNINVTASRNRIHNMFDAAAASTSTLYSIYVAADGVAGQENKIINNLIYNTGGNGIVYGIYNTTGPFMQAFHNTIVLNDVAATSGAAYGLYQTGSTAGLTYKNNIVVVSRTGTGIKRCVYFVTTTSSIASNNNVFYMNVVSGTNNHLGQFGTTNYTTLNDWKTANNGAYDQLSIHEDPLFVSASSGDYTPSAVPLNNIGDNIGVTSDILGTARNIVSPDPGAYEFSVAGCVNPPTPGTAESSVSNVCSGAQLTLSLSGNSLGDGQTYQWQSSSDNTNWSNIGTASTNSSFNTSQTANTWYRCAVKCGFGVTVFSSSVFVTTPPLVSGNFTINGALATGGTNFQTFEDAIAYLSCGINGPIVFDVNPANGPYNEQVVIPEIPGTSTSNTITFNGNMATLSFSSALTGQRAGIWLNGADHVIIDSLIIDGKAGTYAWGIVLTNQADSNVIRNCTIDIGNLTSTSANYVGVVLNGSATGTAVSGNNANGNLFEKNTIKGGYYGFYVYGSSSANNSNNKFIGNTILDNYAYGIYMIYQSNILVSGNNISRPSRTTSTTIGAVYLTTNSVNALIEKNRIHNMFDAFPTSTSVCYGVYIGADAVAGQENMVVNNLIYNTGGNGIIYGIYNTGAPFMRAYHNTISLDDIAATSGNTYGLYQTTAAANIDYKNNIVSISRSGTGIKRCIYFVTTTSTITSNNNVLFMNAAAGTDNHVGQFGTTNYTTIADWKTANSNAYDQQSISYDPLFTSPSTGEYIPASTFVDDNGVNVGVITDISGNTRSATNPDPGAYEFSTLVAGVNMGAETLLTPSATPNGCYSPNEAITVRIKNLSTTAINFTTKPVTVTVNVTGAVTQTLTAIVNSGTLASNATLDVPIATTLNMSTAGTYTFNAFTTVAGDTNPADDAMPPSDRVKEVLSAGTITSSPPSYCVTTGIPTLTTNGASGFSSIQWQQSTTSGSGFTDIAGATTSPYTVGAALTQTMYYQLIATCGSVSQTSAEITVAINNPQLNSTMSAVRCGPGTVTLGATGSAGATINWYTTATGGVPLATGASFTTPVLNTTTTYYVGAGFGSSTANLGPLSPAIGTQSASNIAIGTQGGFFDVIASTARIVSVDVYPTAAVGSSFSIEIRNSSGTTIYTSPTFVTTVTGGTTPQTVVLNADIPAGTGYRIGQGTAITLMRNTTGAVYPYTLPGIISLTGNSFDPDYYYYYYNWQVGTGCESPRTAVNATVNSAPAFSVAKDTIVCNNAITALSVESNIADFDSYTWSPITGLFTDAAATIPYTGGSAITLYTKMATEGVHKYYITANNSSTLCGGLDSVELTVLPASLTIQATRSGLCDPGATTLSIPAGEYGNALQWYSSDDGVIYLPIAGATGDTYNTPILTATTYFKAEMRNGATGMVCVYDTIVISVGNPQVLSTTSATRCDAGSVTLQATASSLAQLNWYQSATGGSPLYTGSSFSTPVISATTTYYVGAGSGFSLLSAGRVAPTSPTNLAASPRGIQFNATVPVKLVSVTVFSTSADAGSGTIELRNSAGTLIAGPVNVNWVGGGTTANPIPNVLTLNFDVPIGTGHRLLMATRTGGGIAYQTSGITGTWPTYSSAGGEIELTASMTSLTGTSTTAYYYFFDWKVSTGCESPRIAVDAVINNTITIDAGPANKTLCSDGQQVVFSVVATGAITNYQWRKDGVDIPGATSPIYTIASSSIADAGGYDVVVSGPCDTTASNIATLTIIAPAVVTTDPVSQQICPGGSVTFSASATGDGSLGYQWRKNGINIVGAYNSTLTITNISAADIGDYDVMVTGSCNKDSSAIASLTLSDATAVTTNPLAQTVCAGANVTFTAAGSGTGTLSYQWRKAGVNISGATSPSYTITGVTTSNAGIYDVMITGSCGSAISSVAGLTVNPGTVITSQPVAQSVCIGSNVTLSVTASGSGTLSYQWRKDGNNISGATSSSYTITGLTPADIAGYDVVITGSCGSVTSSTAALAISAAGSWIGVINSDWNNAANWCGGIPTSTSDVTISTVAPNMPVLSNAGSARNITIQAGASLTIATSGVLNLYGNITGAGTFTSAAGSIAFRGTTAQSVPAFTATNVTMNGAGGFTLAGNTVITGTLTLTNGHITLGSNDLTLANTAIGSVGSHIITNGSGNVIVSGLAASATRIVPVAFNASTYNPVTLTANPGHATDNIIVSVKEHVLTNGTSGGQINEYVVDRTWLINEMTTGGSNVNITLQWSETEERTNFGRNESYVMQYSGGAWIPGVESPANGTGPFLQTKTNVTTFSPFAIQTDPLPNAVTGIFPNPTNSILNVLIRTNAPENVTVSVYDESGKLVKTQAESVGYGGTLLQVDVSRLVAGTYILKVSIPRDREFLVRRFIKTN